MQLPIEERWRWEDFVSARTYQSAFGFAKSGIQCWKVHGTLRGRVRCINTSLETRTGLGAACRWLLEVAATLAMWEVEPWIAMGDWNMHGGCGAGEMWCRRQGNGPNLTLAGYWTGLEHFVMLEMMQESGESCAKGTCYTSWYAGGTK